MIAAAESGHRDLVDFFIAKGADDWNEGMRKAVIGGHRDLVDFFITKGANSWDHGLNDAIQANNIDLVVLFISKGAKRWDVASFMAEGNELLYNFFQTIIKASK